MRQLGLYILLGIVIWFVFLVLMRLLGETVFTPNTSLLALFFMLVYPVIYVTILLVSKLIGIPSNKMFVPVVIMTFTALTCDGLAVGFTDFYGVTDAQIRASGAYLLFGGAGGMIVAWLMEGRPLSITADV